MRPTEKLEEPAWWTVEHDADWQSARPAVKDSWSKKLEAQKTSNSGGLSEAEPALRFGHGARRHYDTTGKVAWTDAEPKLEADWAQLNHKSHPWAKARSAVLHGWDSHIRPVSHGPAAGVRPTASGLGASPAGDSGSGTGDA